ncbi:hypothetical protein [Actinomyces mediterranea]|uniref:hypothetical protein n=1 Tax=Actinomyces mediterranea TaxID=1871028 RepID=UPI001356529F|nr:hypothetical protein [Actinomyces mediterranea]
MSVNSARSGCAWTLWRTRPAMICQDIDQYTQRFGIWPIFRVLSNARTPIAPGYRVAHQTRRNHARRHRCEHLGCLGLDHERH